MVTTDIKIAKEAKPAEVISQCGATVSILAKNIHKLNDKRGALSEIRKCIDKMDAAMGKLEEAEFTEP